VNPQSLGSFVLRVLLWLPPCFAAWYWTATFHAGIAAAVARWLAERLSEGLIAATEQVGRGLVFVTTVQMQVGPGQAGVLTVDVNPLVYTYGVALFAALSLAAKARWWTLPLGIALLLPFQGWGIAFDLLAQLGTKLGPEVAAHAGLAGWRAEAVALGYQAGSLLLPSLAPVALWVAFNPQLRQHALVGRAVRGVTPA
jgi:hypothetical protein